MNNKKNIDRLFQEKFKDFEVAPNDAVWDLINESLPNKKKKRRVIALWWQVGGVAAVIALLLTVGVSVFNIDDNNNQNLPVVNTNEDEQIKDALKTPKDYKQDKLKDSNDTKLEFVDSDSQDASRLKYQKGNTPLKKINSKQLIIPKKSPTNIVANNSNEKEDVSTSQNLNKLNTITRNDNSTRVIANTKSSNKSSEQSKNTKLTSKPELKSVIDNTIEDHKTATVDNSTSNKTETESDIIKNIEGISTDESNLDSVIAEDSTKESIQDAIAEHIEAIDEKKDNQNRWSIAPNVAPVYYGSLGRGSSLDQQFNENSKGSDINMSYGITGAYAVSKKLKIRAGINRVNLNQSTSNVFAFAGPEITSRGTQEAQPSGNITFNDKQNVMLMSSKMLGISSAPEAFSTKTAGDIDQRFGFIEVPLELEYRLVDRKFGINVVGGFSTFFLNENEIYMDIEGTSTLIGEANNINNSSFSANFGLGLDYSLSKQWNINLEPTFKYQINTFNNTSGNFKPFFIGVYTGLSFKF
jgi:hypothetical protein